MRLLSYYPVFILLFLVGCGTDDTDNESSKCADLKALNYSPDAVGSVSENCDYSAITFYSLSGYYYTNDTDSVKINNIIIYLNKTEESRVVDSVARLTSAISDTPVCYIPTEGVVEFKHIRRRKFTWSINIILEDSIIQAYNFGQFEPDINCQVIKVYPK